MLIALAVIGAFAVCACIAWAALAMYFWEWPS